MPLKSRADLKNTFVNGYIPTGADFCDVFDSYIHKNDGIQIDADGNIGIDCAPIFGQKLEICGNAVLRWNTYYPPNTQQGILFLGDTNHYIKAKHGQGVYLGTYNGDEGLHLREGGNVGIKADEPKELLQIGEKWTFHSEGHKFIGYNQYWDGANGTLKRVGQGSASELRFKNDGSIHITTTNTILGQDVPINYSGHSLSIANTGNVGIGIANPTYKLDIRNGNINVENGNQREIRIKGDTGSPSWRARLFLDRTDDYRGAGVQIAASNGSEDDWFIGVPYTGDGFIIGYHGSTPYNKSNSKIYVKGDGKVGIGTYSPVNGLSIESNYATLGLSSGTSNGYTYIELRKSGGPSSTRSGWLGYGDGTNDFDIRNEIAGGNIKLKANEEIQIYSDIPQPLVQHPLVTLYNPILRVDGEIVKRGNGNCATYSDKRVKKNIKPLKDGLKKLLLLKPVTFEYNGKGGFLPSTKNIGLIAQEVQKIFPYMVGEYSEFLNKEDKEKTPLLTLNTGTLIFAVINAIKELNQKIENLKKQINEKNNSKSKSGRS